MDYAFFLCWISLVDVLQMQMNTTMQTFNPVGQDSDVELFFTGKT